jgi:hypothetical protein
MHTEILTYGDFQVNEALFSFFSQGVDFIGLLNLYEPVTNPGSPQPTVGASKRVAESAEVRGCFVFR